uniref:Peptidase S26 domain-containing protein n=1 Tax=Aegilops tauschii subsp. strangulata TaxID=200361 RepID=A0A453DMF1_AEGTS
MFGRPSVGDIVFFRVPTALQNCGISKDVVFIKRVIAVLIETSSRSGKASLLLTVLHRTNTTPHRMRRTRWKPWEEDQKWHGCSVLLTS